MHELDIINKRLGGHQINIGAVESMLHRYSLQQPITIAEIGCGGGDNLRALYLWSKKNNINVSFNTTIQSQFSGQSRSFCSEIERS